MIPYMSTSRQSTSGHRCSASLRACKGQNHQQHLPGPPTLSLHPRPQSWGQRGHPCPAPLAPTGIQPYPCEAQQLAACSHRLLAIPRHSLVFHHHLPVPPPRDTGRCDCDVRTGSPPLLPPLNHFHHLFCAPSSPPAPFWRRRQEPGTIFEMPTSPLRCSWTPDPKGHHLLHAWTRTAPAVTTHPSSPFLHFANRLKKHFIRMVKNKNYGSNSKARFADLPKSQICCFQLRADLRSS